MLKDAYDYSNSTKKQFEDFKGNFENFKKETIANFERKQTESLDSFEIELENKLRALEDKRKQLLDKDSLRKQYGEENNISDPLALYGQGFQGFYNKRSQSVNSQINNEKNVLIEEFEKLVERMDKTNPEIQQLENTSPESFFDVIKELAREQIIEAKGQGKSLNSIIQELERSSEIEDKLLASFLREEQGNEERNRRRNRTPEEIEEERERRRQGRPRAIQEGDRNELIKDFMISYI